MTHIQVKNTVKFPGNRFNHSVFYYEKNAVSKLLLDDNDFFKKLARFETIIEPF
jgi:hypothetical protein